ncbi:MAG TPA: YncE family protein [Clostridia bacterium]|nr:YncE family protein [Clostridia bacterium]
MKRAALAVFTLALAGGILISCGGGGNNTGSNAPVISKIANRVLVSNSFNGELSIVDAAKDLLSGFKITVGGMPQFMVVSDSKNTTLVFESDSNNITAVDNATETRIAAFTMPSWTESVTVTSDGKTAYAAVRNATVENSRPGAIQIMDLRDTQKITGTINVPNVRWIAMDHQGKKLLAFSDGADTVKLIDLTTEAKTPADIAGPFSRPVAAYFSSDDSKAYILSCGAECGGAAVANVTELTIATGAVRKVDVPAATIGVLDGNNLYVAGAPNGSGGAFSAVDTSTMTIVAGTPVTIGPGFHSRIALAGGKVWIGARNCQGSGCLSIVNVSDKSVLIDNPGPGQTSKGDVTGITTVANRNVMYVVEGAELRVYDISTGNEMQTQLDVVGIATDVKSIT